MTHVTTSIFQGLFKTIVFGSIAFYTDRTALYPTLSIKKMFFTKNPLKFYSFKITTFHSDSVKNESAYTKKLKGRPQTPPLPACLGLKFSLSEFIVWIIKPKINVKLILLELFIYVDNQLSIKHYSYQYTVN